MRVGRGSVQSLGWEDPLEKEMATHSSTLAWKIPWMEETGRLQSMGLRRVRHDWVNSLSLSVQFSRSVVSNSLWPQGMQHARLPCPSPTTRAITNSFQSRWWCYPTISSSVLPFSSCPQSFPTSLWPHIYKQPLYPTPDSLGKNDGMHRSPSVHTILLLPVHN